MTRKPLTPLEALIVAHFKAQGGVFALDADGDIVARKGDKSAVTNFKHSGRNSVSAACFLVFDQTSMSVNDAKVVRTALEKAGRAYRNEMGKRA